MIAVGQTVPIRGDVAANVAEHLHLAGIAARENASVVVFPELSLTGYEIGLASGLAFTERDSRLDPLIEAAAVHSLTIIAGAPVRIGSNLHVGAFILSPDGTVSLYTKQHLGAFSASAAVDGTVPPAEATIFTAGDRNPMIEAAGYLAAFAICADAGRATHAAAAAQRGATAYLASMFVIPSELDRDSANLREYARRHSMLVAMANYGGPTGGLASAGRSSIWSPTGELLVQLHPAGRGIAVSPI